MRAQPEWSRNRPSRALTASDLIDKLGGRDRHLLPFGCIAPKHSSKWSRKWIAWGHSQTAVLGIQGHKPPGAHCNLDPRHTQRKMGGTGSSRAVTTGLRRGTPSKLRASLSAPTPSCLGSALPLHEGPK